MKFSVFDLSSQCEGMTQREVYRSFGERAALAEASGLGAYYISEHHFDPGFAIVPSPHLLIPTMAESTSEIRLGVMCTILPQHHPVRVAEEIRMMDLLSDGRLEIGFGRGAQEHEQVGYGVDRVEAATLFDQSLELVTTLLRDNEINSYDTGPWKGGHVRLVPEATQRPHPPMWMTAVSDTSLTKAGRLGLKVAGAFLEAKEVERAINVYREGWAAAHDDGSSGHFASMNHVFVAESEEQVNKLARPHVDGWLEGWLGIVGQAPEEGAADRGYEEHAAYYSRIANTKYDYAVDNDMVLFGTPEQVAAQLLRFDDRGVDEFMGWFQFGGLDPDAANRSIELFGTEVIPRVKAELGVA